MLGKNWKFRLIVWDYVLFILVNKKDMGRFVKLEFSYLKYYNLCYFNYLNREYYIVYNI